MALTHVSRADANFISGASYTSAAIPFVTNRLYVAEVWSNDSVSGVPPTSVAGSTMVFTKIADKPFAWNGSFVNISVWAALGNGNTETFTATWASAPSVGIVFLEEWSTDAGTWASPADAIPQVADPTTGSGTSWTSNTLGALRSADSYGVGLVVVTNTTITAGAGFTVEGAFGQTSPSFKGSGEYKLDASVASASWSTARPYGGIIYEIAEPSGGATYTSSPAGVIVLDGTLTGSYSTGGTVHNSSPNGAIQVCGNAAAAYSRVYNSSPQGVLNIGGSAAGGVSGVDTTYNSNPDGTITLGGLANSAYSNGVAVFNPAIHGGWF